MTNGNSGQILLITILVLTVATTIGLSLVGRATLDVSMSAQLEESSRAFNAAEAGIEEALQSGAGTAGSVVLTPGISYTSVVNAVGGSTGLYRLSHKTAQRSTETLWLVEHNPDGSLDETPVYTGNTVDICWSHASPAPALVVNIIYKEGAGAGGYKTARLALDPNAAVRANNFSSDGIIATNGCGLAGFYRKQVNFNSVGISMNGANADTLIAMRMRPEYADTHIAVNTLTNTLARQGNEISSTGRSESGISRKIVVYQQYKAPSGIFDSVIYSQSSFQ